MTVSLPLASAEAEIAVDLGYEHIGSGDRSMLMVSANGTAVRLG